MLHQLDGALRLFELEDKPEHRVSSPPDGPGVLVVIPRRTADRWRLLIARALGGEQPRAELPGDVQV